MPKENMCTTSRDVKKKYAILLAREGQMDLMILYQLLGMLF